MSREMQYFMILIERYAAYKNSTAGDMLTKWDDLDITNKIYNLYESYHGKDFEEVFAEIDRITKEAE